MSEYRGEQETLAGAEAFERWLATPVAPEPHLQAELFMKVVLAILVGRSAKAYLDTQRAAHLARIRELTSVKRSGTLVDTLLADHALFRVEADLRWIDLTEARLEALAQELEK